MVEAQSRFEQASRLKDAYLLAVSHDLRTPVAALAGSIDLLRSRLRADDADTHLVDLMGKSLRHIEEVLENLLDVERLEHGGHEVVRRPTDLAALVDHCIGLADLERPVRTDVPRRSVAIDPGVTKRILLNLLSNADRHSPPGAEISIGARVDEEGVVISVDDQGPGIPSDARESVFDLFHQLSRDGAGTGVGLFLVRRFAEAHGGSAVIDDGPAGGVSARVRLRF